jgi:hypothetical protein
MVQVSLAHIKKADEPGPAPSLGTAPARPFAPVPGKGLSKLVTNKDAALEKFLLRKQGTLAPQQMELVSMAQRKIAETPAERLSGATVWKKVQREDRAGAAAQSLPRSRRKQKGDGKKQRGRGSGAGQGGQGTKALAGASGSSERGTPALRLQENGRHGFTLHYGWDPADPDPLECRWAASIRVHASPSFYSAATCAGVSSRDPRPDVR